MGSNSFAKRVRELLRAGAVPPGFVAIKFIRSNVEIDGRLTFLGDEIALPETQANALVRNNAAVFIGPAAGDVAAASSSGAAA